MFLRPAPEDGNSTGVGPAIYSELFKNTKANQFTAWCTKEVIAAIPLATILGMMYFVFSAFMSKFTGLETKLTGLETKFDTKFAGLETKFDVMMIGVLLYVGYIIGAKRAGVVGT